eukprot:4646576-Prymnesium_polylepis.2
MSNVGEQTGSECMHERASAARCLCAPDGRPGRCMGMGDLDGVWRCRSLLVVWSGLPRELWSLGPSALHTRTCT